MSKVKIEQEIRKGVSQGFGEKSRTKYTVPVDLLVSHAKNGSLEALWAFFKAKADYPRGYAPKKEIKKFKAIVASGLAREGKTHIHFVKNSSFKGKLLVTIEHWMLNERPQDIAFMLLQSYFLRTQSLKGRRKHEIIRNIRMVCKDDSGGVCLDIMAGYFGKTKQWASWMRKRLEKRGWCSYTRRHKQVSKEEVAVAKEIGLGGLYSFRHGFRVKEITSSCNQAYLPVFKRVYSLDIKSSAEKYESMKREGKS
jgi:hypothetical protein